MSDNTPPAPFVNSFAVGKPGKPKFTPAARSRDSHTEPTLPDTADDKPQTPKERLTLAYFLKDRNEGVPMQNSPVPAKGKRSQTPSPKKQSPPRNVPAPKGMSSIGAPQIKIIDGKVVLDKESLTQASNASENMHADMEVVNESDRHLTSATFAKRKVVSNRWTPKETDLFYECLQTCGTDFSMIQTLLPHRTRSQVKGKFKLEERANPLRISHALDNQLPFDPSLGERIQQALSEESSSGPASSSKKTTKRKQ